MAWSRSARSCPRLGLISVRARVKHSRATPQSTILKTAQWRESRIVVSTHRLRVFPVGVCAGIARRTMRAVHRACSRTILVQQTYGDCTAASQPHRAAPCRATRPCARSSLPPRGPGRRRACRPGDRLTSPFEGPRAWGSPPCVAASAASRLHARTVGHRAAGQIPGAGGWRSPRATHLGAR